MKTILSNKLLWILLLALVVLRLPHINRPLSKHHEFNTAVILINMESWRQAGGGHHFYYTPLMNYQGAANKKWESGPHIDAWGNHVYLSFGPGWYVFPYSVFQLLKLPAIPIFLQLLNILVGIITVLLLYRLLWQITGKYRTALMGATVFALLPAPLWYMGTGYVTTAIMLPLVLLIAGLWHRFAQDPANIKPTTLLLLLLYGVALTYIDWLTPFLLGAMAVWAQIKASTHTRYLWLAVVAGLAIAAGIILPLAQFAQYTGWQQVITYWQLRFGQRSADTEGFSRLGMLQMVMKNLVTGLLPLLLWLALAIVKAKKILRSPQPLWLWWALGGVLLYNLIFFNWSAVHEFAWMAFALIASVVVAVFVLPQFSNPWQKKLTIASLLLCIVQYYYINRPGPTSWKGDRYEAQMLLGKQISQAVPADLPIFTNLANDPIVQFYAKRTFNASADTLQAVQLMKISGLKQAIWLNIENNQLKEQRHLKN